MKILHTADWHLGTFRSPVKDGVNLRTEDTKRCLDEMIRVAREEKPDYSLVSGDVFHVGRLWSDRCCEEIITAIHYIRELAAVSKQVVVMRGTPNHDGTGQFNVLSEMFADAPNVHVVITPQVISFDDVDIAVLPGFDRGVFRAKHPGLSSDEENVVFTNELSNIVTGLKAQCSTEKKSILMTHYTVPGCNTESGQTMMLTQFEPIIPQEALMAANYTLVALGHIHRPQKIQHREWYYAGAINAMNFNDEGQERGFWIHNWNELGVWQSIFHNTPIREFATIELNDEDITQINMQAIDFVATEKWRGEIEGKIVRVHYSCTAENSKALNKAKEKLATHEALYVDIAARRECELAKTGKVVEEKLAEMNAIGFDAAALTLLQSECAALLPYVSQLEAISQRESKIALIKADLEHLKSNISQAENRLAEVKLKGTQAETERDVYSKAFEEHVQVLSAITALDPWVEKEKMLPVAEERNSTALNRVLELSSELINIDDEIAERQAEADKEILAMAGMEEALAIVNGLEAEVNAINSVVKERQMRIGALQQKAEQIAKLKQDIAGLQDKQVEYAKETADYDTLKVAFSQSGVPHQIIRSIIPQLTATANTILGQMTGGKMGVEFRLERLQKNGKEKVSLDIFIEEYGKSVLPYLSKSGGEKVKSWLIDNYFNSYRKYPFIEQLLKVGFYRMTREFLEDSRTNNTDLNDGQKTLLVN